MDTFFIDIIKKEIDGKIQAIHEYDNMLWKLRIGFLTLFFAGWGVLLNTLLKTVADEQFIFVIDLNTILLLMATITIVICIGGFLIDMNYAKRKYRVINSVDSVYDQIFNVDKAEDLSHKVFRESIYLAGCRDDKEYLKISGFKKERMISYLIYFLPIISMISGIALLWN